MSRIYSRRIVGLFSAVALLVVLLAKSGCGRPKGGSYAGALQPVLIEDVQEDLNHTYIVLARQEILHNLERPPVVFDHRQHAEALKEKGCQACHATDEEDNRIYEFF